MKNIVLPKSFIDFDLYAVSNPKNPLKDKSLSVKKMSGSNQKQTLVVYSYEKGKEGLSDSHRLLLEKIFSAIKYDFEKDTALLGLTSNEPFIFEEIKVSHNFKYLICFGVSPSQIGLSPDFEKYRATLNKGVEMIFADSVEEISIDKTKKMSLWKSLQATFLK